MSVALSSLGKQLTVYVGTPVFIAGIVGGLLNTIVFLSFRTFRQSSCAFYLTIMSIVNICNLFLGLFFRIVSSITGTDATETSLIYCKVRLYSANICSGTSMTCWCLATIDQYLATSTRPHWQRFCNIKLARRLVIISIVTWMLHGIPYVVFYDHVLVPAANKMTCINTNHIHEQYRTYFILLVLVGYIPIVIAAIFGSMAYYNVQQMAYRTVPLVRRELDKQLTVMVLVQVVVNIFTLLPYTTATAIGINKSLTSDPVVQEKLQLALAITYILFSTTFTTPFYIYMCTSNRFRRQLVYVLSNIRFNRLKRQRTDVNQVAPEI